MVYNVMRSTFTVPAAIKDRLHSRTGLELPIIFDNANREIIFTQKFFNIMNMQPLNELECNKELLLTYKTYSANSALLLTEFTPVTLIHQALYEKNRLQQILYFILYMKAAPQKMTH